MGYSLQQLQEPLEINDDRIKGRLAGYRLWAVLCLFAVLPAAFAATDADSVRVEELEEFSVTALSGANARIAADGSVSIDAAAAGLAPRLFGETDLIFGLLGSAGVATVSDYSSGVSIDGMDYANNAYLINGVPVGFPYHFGGIFSTFNSAHYPHACLWKSIHPTGSEDCLGGIVETCAADRFPSRTSATVNVGMMASSATLRQPLGDRITVTASARVSYIDFLYQSLLKTIHTDARYGFHDIDLDVSYRPGDCDTLRIWGHYNKDRLNYDDSNYAMTTSLRWHNLLGGVQWSGRNVAVGIGYSAMTDRLSLLMPPLSVMVPSGHSVTTASGSYGFAVGAVRMTAGAAVKYITVDPQRADVTGFGHGDVSSAACRSHALLTKIPLSAAFGLFEHLSVDAGIDANGYFGAGGYNLTHIDPRLSVSWRHDASAVTLHAGRYHQYLHQVGLSEIGMASNFKLNSSSRIPPAQSWNFAAEVSQRLPFFGLKANAGVYYKLVDNMPEYSGQVIDLLDPGYVAESHVDVTDGYNAGFNLTVARDFDNLTASAAYGYTVAKRRLPGSQEYFTSSSEIRNSVNISAAYRFHGGRWSVSASWACADGRPVTPVTAAYFIGERLMVEYGRRNSRRLPAYHRLDLGANYRFHSGRFRHTVSLALINAYGHRNVEISTYTFDIANAKLGLRQVSSLYRFLPSISYTIDF